MSHDADLGVSHTRHRRENGSDWCVSVSVARQTHLRRLIFSSNFPLFVKTFPRRASARVHVSGDGVTPPPHLLLRGFDSVQPGRRSA